jgi:hypothetical protein
MAYSAPAAPTPAPAPIPQGMLVRSLLRPRLQYLRAENEKLWVQRIAKGIMANTSMKASSKLQGGEDYADDRLE